MKQDEAKTKWCPMVVASHTNPRVIEPSGTWLHGCIGSDCMMWREGPDGEAARNGEGYCGLAGKPHFQ